MNTSYLTNSSGMLFFSNFLQRENLVLDNRFEEVHGLFQNIDIAGEQYHNANETQKSFNVFRQYMNYPGTIWYVCILLYANTLLLQRFYIYFQGICKIFYPELQRSPYNEIMQSSKEEILKNLENFAQESPVNFHLLTNVMKRYF
jgi:hypothetical protein